MGMEVMLASGRDKRWIGQGASIAFPLSNSITLVQLNIF